MKKTFLTLLLTTALFLVTACSGKTDFNEEITFIRFTDSSSKYTITEGGTYHFSGVLNEEKISVEANQDVTLILSGVEITNSNDEAIKIENTGTTVIRTADGTNNTITSGGDSAINAKSSIIIEGDGTLNINGTKMHGIESDADITVNSGNINIDSYEHGMKSESKISILGGTIDIHSQTGKGIKAEKEFLGENGNVTIVTDENEGLESKGALTINGGKYNITAGEDGINAGTSDSTTSTTTAEEAAQNMPENENAIPQGGESTGAVPPEGAQPDRFRPEEGFPMDGEGEQKDIGEMPHNKPVRGERPVMDAELLEEPRFDIPPDVTYSGTGLPMGGRGDRGGFGRVNEDSVLTINGGYIKINCLGDGIDSNGSLTINGGTIIIDGPENSGNGPLDSDGEMLINGATVLTASSRGMTQMPRSMTQGIISYTFVSPLSAGDEITIMDSEQKIIIEHKIERICEMLVFTSPDISADEEYTIYVNGKEHTNVGAVKSLQNEFPSMRGGKHPFEFPPEPTAE